MNIENLTKVAEVLEAKAFPTGIGFNMNYLKFNLTDAYMDTETHIEHPCGTVCCIAGLVNEMFGGNDTFTFAEKTLGIDDEKYRNPNRPFDPTENELFFPSSLSGLTSYENWAKITPTQAAKVIRNLIATDKVDWSIIEKEDECTDTETPSAS